MLSAVTSHVGARAFSSSYMATVMSMEPDTKRRPSGETQWWSKCLPVRSEPRFLLTRRQPAPNSEQGTPCGPVSSIGVNTRPIGTPPPAGACPTAGRAPFEAAAAPACSPLAPWGLEDCRCRRRAEASI